MYDQKARDITDVKDKQRQKKKKEEDEKACCMEEEGYGFRVQDLGLRGNNQG